VELGFFGSQRSVAAGGQQMTNAPLDLALRCVQCSTSASFIMAFSVQ
jgi:hypothetical protein